MSDNKLNKGKHGGARIRAGRKPVDNPKVKLNLSIDSEAKQHLKALSNKSDVSQAKIIEWLIFKTKKIPSNMN